MPGELKNYAETEGTKAVTKFSSDGTTGLQLSVETTKLSCPALAEDAAVYVTAVLE